MKSSARRVGLAALLFSLAGCGLKGPLYLPDDKQQQVPPPAGTQPQPALEGSKILMPPPPAPQAQKRDRDRTDQSAPNPSTTPGQSQPPPVSPPDPDRPATIPPPGN